MANSQYGRRSAGRASSVWMLRQARRKSSWSRSSASSGSPVRPSKKACNVAWWLVYSSSNCLLSRVGVIGAEDSSVPLGGQHLQHRHERTWRDELAVEDDLTHLRFEQGRRHVV